MKRTILLFFILLSITFNLSAYDYQTVYSNRIALFADSTNVAKGLRIDSAKYIGDSILYPFKNIQQFTENCFTPYGASWMGAKIVIQENWNYFFNETGDTIKIKTNAKLNEQWKFFQNGNVSVWATVKKVEQLSFLGLTDSVKTITFWGGLLTSNIIQGQKSILTVEVGSAMLLSKHYGIINSPGFLYFPNQDKNTKYFTGSWEDNRLVGLTNPKVGVQNLTWFDVNDFQVGDEIHNLYQFSPPLMSPAPIISERKVILKYFDRHNYKDSIIYQIDRVQSIVNKFGVQITSTDYIHDTVVSTIKLSPLFEKLPLESVIFDNYALAYSMGAGATISKTEPSFYDVIVGSNDNDGCWRRLSADGCYSANTYIKGLGGPYYSCSGFMGDSEENTLVYYKKGSTTWGTPLVLTGINQPKDKEAILVFPNPTTGLITINSEILTESCVFEIMDLRGVVIIKAELDANRNSVNIENFSNGLFMYRLTNNGKLLKSGKVVKM